MKTMTLKQLTKNVLKICNTCNNMAGVQKCSSTFAEVYLQDMSALYDEFIIFINPLYDIFITGNLDRKGMGYMSENDLVLQVKKQGNKYMVIFV